MAPLAYDDRLAGLGLTLPHDARAGTYITCTLRGGGRRHLRRRIGAGALSCKPLHRQPATSSSRRSSCSRPSAAREVLSAKDFTRSTKCVPQCARGWVR